MHVACRCIVNECNPNSVQMWKVGKKMERKYANGMDVIRSMEHERCLRVVGVGWFVRPLPIKDTREHQQHSLMEVYGAQTSP